MRCFRQLCVEFSSTAMSLCSPMCRVVSRCFAVLRQLRSIRRSVSDSAFHSLVVSLVMPRLSYCNAILAGLPASQLSRLQSVLNAAARLIHQFSQYEHVTLILQDLHWLRCPECIDFKLVHLPMPARPGATVSFRLHQECCRFQLSLSPVVVILAASDLTYTAVHCW